MIIWLTGGIGCGKSSVATMFAALGARTIDADAIVHSLYERTDVQTAVGAVVGLETPLTRSDVARRVFGDDAVLRSLEAVLHPLVRAEFARERAATPDGELLLIEIPLPPTPEASDVVICVEADERIRVERLRGRGMQDADIFARIAAAPGRQAYKEHATFVIENNQDLAALQAAALRVWKELPHGESAI